MELVSDRRAFVPSSIFIVLGAGVALYFAVALRVVDCGNEASSECGTHGLVQLIIAGVGMLPALGLLVESFRARGHPWRWFWTTAFVYAVWGLYLWLVFLRLGVV